MTKVYIYDRSTQTIDINNLYDNLKYESLKDKYYTYENKIDSLIGYTLLNKYLKEDFDITDTNILFNEYSKPYLKDIYFNISHSYNYICLIISDDICGIDIERIDNDREYDLMARKTLSSEEYNIYINIENKTEYFISEWVKKEAYLKALGTGIILSKLKELNINLPILKLKDKFNNEYVLAIYSKENYIIEKDCTL